MEESNKQFDTAEYAYLDKLTLLAGWMWEFIRRSPDYSQRYDRIKELSQKAVLKATSKEFYFHNYKFTKS
ncbi:MAG: transcriptional regulator domain-containing protein, partial [Candidatus Hodarchaeota archaeon]